MCTDSRFAEPRISLRGRTDGYFLRRAKSNQKAHGVCRPGRDKLSAKRKVSKGFNFVSEKLLFGCTDSRFAEPRCSLQRERIVTFCVVQKVTKKHARTCKKLPVASFCASETAETGRIANGREQGDHVSRRRGGDRLPQATQKGGIAAERCRRWRRKSTRSVPSRQGQTFCKAESFKRF